MRRSLRLSISSIRALVLIWLGEYLGIKLNNNYSWHFSLKIIIVFHTDKLMHKVCWLVVDKKKLLFFFTIISVFLLFSQFYSFSFLILLLDLFITLTAKMYGSNLCNSRFYSIHCIKVNICHEFCKNITNKKLCI